MLDDPNFFHSSGIVLFTFLHFNETPAIVTSVVIGLGIVFCGGAVIHNVFIWQRVGAMCIPDTVYSSYFVLIISSLTKRNKCILFLVCCRY